MLPQYLFYFLAFLSILSGIMVVATSKPVYSVLYLIITFFAIAGLYILLNAQFLAAVHIIVYAGAIMVLFLFVLMFLNLNKQSVPHKTGIVKLAATCSAGFMLLIILAALRKSGAFQQQAAGETTSVGLVENLGMALFQDFLLPFEVSSILFLAAIVGVVVLGKKKLS